MLTATIHIQGEELNDLVIALPYIKDKIEKGFKEGSDRNYAGEYRFTVDTDTKTDTATKTQNDDN